MPSHKIVVGVQKVPPPPLVVLSSMPTISIGRSVVGDGVCVASQPDKGTQFDKMYYIKRAKEDFKNIVEGLPQTMCRQSIEDISHEQNVNGRLSVSGGYCFIAVEDLHDRIVENLYVQDPESLGYYQSKHISYATGLSEETVRKYQSTGDEAFLGDTLLANPLGLDLMTRSILLNDTVSVREIVSETFDWDNGDAKCLIYNGMPYYYYELDY